MEVNLARDADRVLELAGARRRAELVLARAGERNPRGPRDRVSAALDRADQILDRAAHHQIAVRRDEARHGAAPRAERRDRRTDLAAREDQLEERACLARDHPGEIAGADLEIGEVTLCARRLERERLVDRREDSVLGGVVGRDAHRAEQAARRGLAPRLLRRRTRARRRARQDVEHLGEGVDVALVRGHRRVEELPDHRERQVFLAHPPDQREPLDVFFAVERDGQTALARLRREPFAEVEMDRLARDAPLRREAR